MVYKIDEMKELDIRKVRGRLITLNHNLRLQMQMKKGDRNKREIIRIKFHIGTLNKWLK